MERPGEFGEGLHVLLNRAKVRWLSYLERDLVALVADQPGDRRFWEIWVWSFAMADLAVRGASAEKVDLTKVRLEVCRPPHLEHLIRHPSGGSAVVTLTKARLDLKAVPIEKRTEAIRKHLGWTQVVMADQLGVNVRQVKRWRAGQIPSEDSAYELADLAKDHGITATPDLFFEPKERREERVLALEKRVDQLERRLRKAGI